MKRSRGLKNVSWANVGSRRACFASDGARQDQLIADPTSVRSHAVGR
jgi:hypothetical protein